MAKNFIEDENGQGLVEYALILALISIATLTVMKALGVTVNSKLEEVNNALTGSTT